MRAPWWPPVRRSTLERMDTTNSTVFIPGATSGIGLALAQRLQAAGSTVVIGGRRQDRLDALAAEHGFDTVAVDVADAASVREAASAVLGRHPDLDTLVTMSGIMRNEDLRDPGHIDDAVATIETNLLGTIRLIDAFLPHLLTRPTATVVTVSSGLAFVPLTATPTYSATKAAVHSYTQALRQQLVGSDVAVVELAPPAVETDLMGGQDFGGMPLDVFADEVMTLLASGADEVLVENVQPLRWAERDGTHRQILEAMAGRGH